MRHRRLHVVGRGEPQEVDVVRVVGHRIQALRPALRDVVLVGRDGELVALHRVGVAADALVDVRGHVHHVAGGRHQRHQRVGGLLGPLRRGRRLEQVDEHVQRAGVLRVLRDHLFGERDDLARALVRLAVGHPVAPGPQVHHRLDVEHRDVEVVRELLMHAAHRLGVGGVVGGAVVGAARVALREGVDERLLARRRLGGQRLRLLDHLEGVRLFVGLHHRVDVGPEHQRLAPVGDGERRIEPRRLAERPPRFGVVERIGEIQALIDEALRAGAVCAHRKGVRAEILQARRQLAVRAGLHRVRR